MYDGYFRIGGYLADIDPINTLCRGRVPSHAFVATSDFHLTDATDFSRDFMGLAHRTRRYGWVAWTNGATGGVPGGRHKGYRGPPDLGLQALNIRNRPDRNRAPCTVTASAVAKQ